MAIRTSILLLAACILLPGCMEAPVADVGETAPDFELEVVNSSGSIQLHNSGDKPIVLNFWATNCGACIKELPALNDIHQSGIADVVGIALDADAQVVQEFVQQREIQFEVVLGTQELFEQFDGYGIPYTLIVDKNKTIRKQFRGAVNQEEIADVIRQIQQLDRSVALK